MRIFIQRVGVFIKVSREANSENWGSLSSSNSNLTYLDRPINWFIYWFLKMIFKLFFFFLFICHSREKAREVITADSTRKKLSQSPWKSYSKGSDGLRWQSVATGNKGEERLPLLVWIAKLTSNPTRLDIQGFPSSKDLVPNITQTVYFFPTQRSIEHQQASFKRWY